MAFHRSICNLSISESIKLFSSRRRKISKADVKRRRHFIIRLVAFSAFWASRSYLDTVCYSCSILFFAERAGEPSNVFGFCRVIVWGFIIVLFHVPFLDQIRTGKSKRRADRATRLSSHQLFRRRLIRMTVRTHPVKLLVGVSRNGLRINGFVTRIVPLITHFRVSCEELSFLAFAVRAGQDLCLKRDLSFPDVFVLTFPPDRFAIRRWNGVRIDFVIFAPVFQEVWVNLRKGPLTEFTADRTISASDVFERRLNRFMAELAHPFDGSRGVVTDLIDRQSVVVGVFFYQVIESVFSCVVLKIFCGISHWICLRQVIRLLRRAG